MATFRYALSAVVMACMLALPAQAMNKAQLVDQLANETSISKADAKRALEGFIQATMGFLDDDDRVVLQNFGALGISHMIAASDGVESIGELDFVAGAGFVDSSDAQRDAFKMRVESAHEAAHVVQQREGVAAMGPGQGMVAVGDIVYLLPGNPSVLAPGRAHALVPLDLLETVRPFEVGDVNDDGKVDALDVQLVINRALGIEVDVDAQPLSAGLGGPVNDLRLEAEVAGVIVLSDAGEREVVDSAEGETVGLLLRGIDKSDIKRGMVIAKPATTAAPGIAEEKQDSWFGSNGVAMGGLRSDGELVQAMARESGLDDFTTRAAYNALLNIIVDEVNADGTVQIIGFGEFVAKTRVSVSIVDHCAGDPEHCLGGVDDPELLEELLNTEYISWQVVLEANGVGQRAFARLVEMAARMAKHEIITGQNPHRVDKEIKINAEKTVVLEKLGDGSVADGSV